jgi:zinc protease
VTHDRAQALADKTFGGLPAGIAGVSPLPLATPPAPGGGRKTLLVDKPERSQSQIIVGHATWPAAHPEFLAQQVGATVFGGTFTARLMSEVRVKRGWSYGASFRAGKTRAGHSVKLRVFPAAEQTPDTLELILRLWDEIVAGGVTEAEVEFAKGYMEGSWAFDLATPAERLDRRTETYVIGVAEDWIETHVHRLRAVTAKDVNEAIRKAWRPDSATIVVTCTADAMRPRLEGLPLGAIETVSFEDY